ncbi:MAG: hypothetical protein M3P51_02920 [Chloroflexota bacterium]|nr:hypothetical protein [Chloroflexota bacterium]
MWTEALLAMVSSARVRESPRVDVRNWWREAGRRISVPLEQPYPGWVLVLLWALVTVTLVSEIVMALRS